MRRLLVLLGVLSLLAFAGTAAAAVAGAPPPKSHDKAPSPPAHGRGGSGIPAFPELPGTWSHAEINITIRGVPHTLILDRGRLVQLSARQLTLLESDGSKQEIAITRKTVVQGSRRRLALALRRPALFVVETMRIDAGPAVRVRVQRALTA